MDVFTLIQNNVWYFLLVLTRVSGIFILSPVFGSRNTPMRIRAGAAFAIALLLLPTLGRQELAAPATVLGSVLAIGGELLVGWLIGFVASLIFSAVQMAGQLLDMQVGFGMVNVLDPVSGQQMPVIGMFQYNLAVLLFLVTDSHHFILAALFDSYRLIPVAGAAFQYDLATTLTDMAGGLFVVALKLSLPVLVAILLTDVALGVLARTMPQMNIFVVGMPAKIIVGIFVLSLALPFYIMFLDVAFHAMYQDIYRALAGLS